MFYKLRMVFLFFVFSCQIYASPLIIAHRGGKENFPENTILAFSKALENGADAIELDVQLTDDKIVVVYHPKDLNQFTNGEGSISSHDYKYISKLDAAYKYKPEQNYPFRGKGLYIPTLRQILDTFSSTFFVIDLKSLPPELLVEALLKEISDQEAKRIIFYSTNSIHIELLNKLKPNWKTFEKRDLTRQRLLEINQKGKTDLPITSHWIGFELKRIMNVSESFTLGNSTSIIEFHPWTSNVVTYLKESDPNVFLVLFGINNEEDWANAVQLNVNGVFSDDPYRLSLIKKKQIP
jgi:glycerophosphoryl diester phosphodiesterase